MNSFLFNIRALSALVLALTVAMVAVYGDVIILKDGYTMYGVKTIKEKKALMDEQTGEIFLGAMPNGMTAVDDGPRWVVFPNTPLQVADVSDTNIYQNFASYTRERTRGEGKFPSTARDPKLLKPWDLKEWTRVIEFKDIDPRLKHTVKQHINVITPHYVRIGSSSHILSHYFLTREFKPETIRAMLVNHPTLLEMPNKPDPEKRERLVRFWIQADWLDEADKDLDTMLTALPAEKERYARLKSEINGIRAEKLILEIERARDSGRHDWAVKAITAFPKDDVPRAVAVKLTGLQADYELRTSRFALAKRFLEELPKQIKAGSEFLVEGAAAVRQEMHMDTLSRLEVFVTLSDRAEKDTKAGRRPTQVPEELLAAAITGWHLGKVAAEPKVGSAYKCWTTRKAALDYLRNTQKGGRIKDLEAYLASPNAMAYDELEKLVSLLPPPNAPAVVPVGPITLKMPPSSTFGNGMSYVLRLPDEYQPGRSYPLLIALPDPAIDPLDEKAAEKMLNLFGDLPNRLGYIVASPIWWGPLESTYKYSADEQSEVLALLRHLQRSFQIDSDRIYLWGNGEGGSMALDMGGGHPDLFAGVIPVNPAVCQPLYIPAEYWVNFHQLPIYMIMGDKFGPSVSAIRMLSERWMPRGFPSLIVSYKGRGAEWFSEEVPLAFDWMGRKRRVDPGKMVGPPAFGERTTAGFSSVRATDNRFHWLSSESLNANRIMSPVLGKPATTPIKFSAKIIPGNAIEAKAFGMKELTIWFGRGMVDYSKPVRLKVNDGKSITEKISPQIPVLMEDLYERGDRQRPYFYRVDMKVPQ